MAMNRVGRIPISANVVLLKSPESIFPSVSFPYHAVENLRTTVRCHRSPGAVPTRVVMRLELHLRH